MMNESCANRNTYLPTIVGDATQLPSVLTAIVLEYLPRCVWKKDDEICASFVGVNDLRLCECHNPNTPKYPYGKCIHTYTINICIRTKYSINTRIYYCGNMVVDGSDLCFQHTYVGDTRTLVLENDLNMYHIRNNRYIDNWVVPHRCIAQKNKICCEPTIYKSIYTFGHDSDIDEINMDEIDTDEINMEDIN